MNAKLANKPSRAKVLDLSHATSLASCAWILDLIHKFSRLDPRRASCAQILDLGLISAPARKILSVFAPITPKILALFAPLWLKISALFNPTRPTKILDPSRVHNARRLSVCFLDLIHASCAKILDLRSRNAKLSNFRAAISTSAKLLDLNHKNASCTRAIPLDLVPKILSVFSALRLKILTLINLARASCAQILDLSHRTRAVFSLLTLAKRKFFIFIAHAWQGKDLNRALGAKRSATFLDPVQLLDLAPTSRAQILDLGLISVPARKNLSAFKTPARKGYAQ